MVAHRGILATLSATTAATVIEVVPAAKRHGTVVSYDLSYRPSLWKAIGGQAKAQEVNRAIAPFIDVMIGNEEDVTASLGFAVEGVDEFLESLPVDTFATMIGTADAAYPNIQVIATTCARRTRDDDPRLHDDGHGGRGPQARRGVTHASTGARRRSPAGRAHDLDAHRASCCRAQTSPSALATWTT